jgi:hypothetical protein
VVSSIESLDGVTILKPPTGSPPPRHETVVIVELNGESTLADLTAAVEDAQTVHRAEILPGVVFSVARKLKPEATPEAIEEALEAAELLEPAEEEAP